MNDNPEWSKSWYFNFHDAEEDLTAFMRIGNKPNKNEKTMFFFLMGKDRTIGMRAAVPYAADAELECNGLKFIPVDGGSWRVVYNGPMADYLDQTKISMVSMDIAWNPVNEEMDYKRCVDERKTQMSSNVASEHFEQFGNIEGTVSINGQAVSVKATGERDRSEGVRDWGSPKMWYWLNSVYDGKYGYDVTKLCTAVGDVDAGYFDAGEGNDPIMDAKIETQYVDGVPSTYTILATGQSGKTYPIEGRVIRHAKLPMAPGMMIVETISETRWNGRTGYGIAEFLVPM